MKQILIAAVASAGIGIWMHSNGWTQDTKAHSQPKPTESVGSFNDGGLFPPQRRPQCRGGTCPTSGFDRFNHRLDLAGGATSPKPRLLDLQTLAFRVEYVSEIISEEIEDEFPRSRFKAALLNLADDVVSDARRFRASIDRGATSSRLVADFSKLTKSFDALARPLRDVRRAVLVDRAMRRADGLLRLTLMQLRRKDGPSATKTHVPPANQRKTKPLTIPANMKGISSLPASLQRAALKQRTCPVSGGLLGGHGKPLVVDINGRTVFVCCQGCIADLKANPDQYLKSK